MKKLIGASVLSASLVISFAPSSFAATYNDLPYVNEILQMQPEITSKELLKDVKSITKNTGDSQEAILEQLYKELKQDKEKGIHENMRTKGGSGGTVGVGIGEKGQIFYTGSQTAYLNHGHVGMYFSRDTIVESVPKEGVRDRPINKRLVDKGDAQVKSVNTTTAKRNAAADWAYSRVNKDDYSYNFASNRNTGHFGDKNCSKLVWSAYLLKSGLDLDVDKGLGVYPRDVRDAKDTALVRKI
jgi:uncharacterized protein YycO